MNPPFVSLRFCTREEYHTFFKGYVADPVMSPQPYRYQVEYVDRSFDYDLSRREWYPVYGVFGQQGEMVGILSLKRIDREKRRCELGVILRDDACKGRGLGTAAVREGVRIAQTVYGVRTILADTTGSNLRMQRVLEKLGFRLTERVERIFDFGDHREDCLYYTLEENAHDA